MCYAFSQIIQICEWIKNMNQGQLGIKKSQYLQSVILHANQEILLIDVDVNSAFGVLLSIQLTIQT